MTMIQELTETVREMGGTLRATGESLGRTTTTLAGLLARVGVGPAVAASAAEAASQGQTGAAVSMMVAGTLWYYVDLRALYRRHQHVGKVAKEMGVSSKTAGKALRQAGVEVRMGRKPGAR